MVGANTDICARMPFGPALPHDDVTAKDLFAAEFLHAETSASGIAAVAGRPACLFMRHLTGSKSFTGNSLSQVLPYITRNIARPKARTPSLRAPDHEG